MSRFAHFNLRECTCIAVGVPLEDGPDTDAWIQFEFPLDWEIDKGADSLIARCRTNDAEVKAKIGFKGYSTDIDKLMAVRNADLNLGGGAGVGRFFFKDGNGTTLISSPRHWIDKAPNFQIGVKRGNVVFDTTMVLPAGSYFIGGNSVS